MEQAMASFGDEQGTNQSGAGGGKPQGQSLGKREAQHNAAKGRQGELVGKRQGTNQRRPTPPRRGATHNSADFGDYSRTRPSARGKRNWQGV